MTSVILNKLMRKGKNHIEKTEHEIMFNEIEDAMRKAICDGRNHCAIYMYKENREVTTGATLELYRPDASFSDDAIYIEDRLITMGCYCSAKFLKDTLTVFIFFEDKFAF